MSYQVQNFKTGARAARRSSVRTSVLSRTSARSDHQNAEPECASVGMIRALVAPSNRTVPFSRGSSMYRAP
jgi:hypothetical protein